MCIWKTITNTNYEVSNYGEVRNSKTKRILKQYINKSGYRIVHLTQYKTLYVHRIVAQMFLNNEYNYKYVNHKDENKQNNNVSNLEWCTHKYNMNYGTRNQKISNAQNKKRVGQFKNNELIAIYESAYQASRETGIAQSSICSCINNRIHKNKHNLTAGGYIWKGVM